MSSQQDFELQNKLYDEKKYAECLPLIDKILAEGGLSEKRIVILMFRKCACLSRIGKKDAMFLACDELIFRFKKSSNPETQSYVARAMLNKGITSGNLGNTTEAIMQYEELISWLKDSPNPKVQVQFARAMLNRGISLFQQGNLEGELAQYDELIRLFKDSSDPEVQVQVAKAMLNKGMTLWQQGKLEGELGQYDELIRRFKDSSDTEVQVQVAKAMLNKGNTFGIQKKFEEELAEYDEIIRLFTDSSNPIFGVHVACAMLNKGISFGRQGKSESERAQYDELIRLFKDSLDSEVQGPVAKAMLNRGITLCQQGNLEGERAQYDELIRLFKDSSDPEVQVQIAKAMRNRGITLCQQGDMKGELAQYDELIRLFKNSSNSEVQVQVAEVMLNKGITLRKLKKGEGERAQYDELIRLFKDSLDSEVQDPVAVAILRKVKRFLRKEQKWEEIFKLLTSYLKLKKLPQHWACDGLNEKDRAEFLYAIISIHEKCNDAINNARVTDISKEINHFTDIKALYSMLEYEKVKAMNKQGDALDDTKNVENILRGYNSIYMNDPSEGRSLVEYSQKYHSENIPDLKEFFKDSESRWVEHEAGKSVYCISFTAASDSLSLWRAYGRDGSGVCIAIPTGTLNQSGDGENHLGGDYIRRLCVKKDRYVGTCGKLAEMSIASVEILDVSECGKKEEGNAKQNDAVMPEDLYRVRYLSLNNAEGFNNEDANKFLMGIKEYIDIINIIKAPLKNDSGKNPTIEKINSIVREAFAGALFLFKDAQYAAEEEYRMITLREIDEDGIYFDEAEIPRLYLKTRPFLFADSRTKITLGPVVDNPENLQLCIERILALNPRFSKGIKVCCSNVRYRPPKKESRNP